MITRDNNQPIGTREVSAQPYKGVCTWYEYSKVTVLKNIETLELNDFGNMDNNAEHNAEPFCLYVRLCVASRIAHTVISQENSHILREETNK